MALSQTSGNGFPGSQSAREDDFRLILVTCNDLIETQSCHCVQQSEWMLSCLQHTLLCMKKVTEALTARAVFARNLRRARRTRDITQEVVALDAGLTRAYVSSVERGARNISIDNMGVLADAVGVPLKDLVDPEQFKDPSDL